MACTMRKAVSMIELVFAIVIIGISIMTVPAMLTQSSSAVLVSTQQEAILAGTTKMGNILSYAWDINQTDSVRNGGYAKVIRASGGDPKLDINEITLRRVGHFPGDKRRRAYSDVNSTDASIAEGRTHIDGFIGDDTLVLTGGVGDYLRGYNTNVKVYFVSDSANYGDDYVIFNLNDTDVGDTNLTNIKFIDMIVTDRSGDDVQIRLFSFSCNIGQTGLLDRKVYE